MKKLIALLLVLPFLVVACGDELFQVSFDYEFESSFLLEPTEEASNFSVASEPFDLSVLRELDERGLAALQAASLSQITLTIPENYETTWAFASAMQLYVEVEGREYMIASNGDISTEAGAEITLEPTAEEFQILDLLGHERATARLDLRTREGIQKTMKIAALTEIRLTASPE